jgi:hypothetical protein
LTKLSLHGNLAPLKKAVKSGGFALSLLLVLNRVNPVPDKSG